MKKISQTIVGIPLRQTNPAAIERFLVQKVRDDLGEFASLVTSMKPLLRVDKEDGDLSGNVTDGFGSVMLDISGVQLHLPFIIHQKELLPFDVIKLGDQEIPYDLSKLRRIVNGIDKKVKEDTGDGGEASSEIVSPKDVNSHNGFLGNIMQIRDDHKSRDINGASLWDGLSFGNMDESRLNKFASAPVDVLEVFSETIEKLASATVIPKEVVDQFLEQLEKKAESESQKQIDAVSEVDPGTFESAQIQRNIAKVREEKLVDVSRVKSGNNIKFPTAEDARFEYRNGRVYRKLKPWCENKRTQFIVKHKGIVLDSKGGYKLLKDRDKFMVTLQDPSYFELPSEEARALKSGQAYAIEIDNETLSHPFKVCSSFKQRMEEDGILVSVPERMNHENPNNENTLFSNSFACEELAGSKNTKYDWTTHNPFTIVISKKQIDKVVHVDEAGLIAYIEDQATDITDAKMARRVADCHYSEGGFIIVPPNLSFFKLESSIKGHFTKADGYFTEGPLSKTAAYDSVNSATLIVERNSKPQTYAVEWQYSDEVKGDTKSTSYNIKKHKQVNLTESQARKVIGDLGYDARQRELFFEIAKRNGRSARFNLADLEKAKGAAPSDKAQNKVNKAFKNIIDSTLNARNFSPLFEDVITEGLAGVISSAAPQSVEWSKKWDSITKDAFETAVEIEKVASELNGPTWHELAALTNLKYRLDKLANEVWDGAFVKDADGVFLKVAELKPAIEKQAQELISFNRKQILNFDKPPVDPRLVKQAVHQLDELYRYASVHEGLKKNETLSKEAGLLNHKTMNQQLKRYENVIGKAQGEVDSLTSKLRDEHIYLRSLKASKKPTTEKELASEKKIDDLKLKIDEKVDALNYAVSQKVDLEGSVRKQNLGMAAGVGLPGLAALSYGYQDLKNK